MNCIVLGDARALPFADGIAQTCVTSPPYWGLRDYGVDGQIGMERTPEEYVEKIVAVAREVWRVLRDDGTLWLNLGDSYGCVGGNTYAGFNQRYSGTGGAGSKQDKTLVGVTIRDTDTGLRAKNLVGVPWRVAFALQADGWYLRSDIIWAKPAPMPESVTDRPTKAHEYVFLLAKSERYYYNAKAIAEQKAPATVTDARGNANGHRRDRGYVGAASNGGTNLGGADGTRNARSVWTITPSRYADAHFATMPLDLARRCVLAGSRPGDVVLDPFMGSGTTAKVAIEHGRRAIGVDLNESYHGLISKRTTTTIGMV